MAGFDTSALTKRLEEKLKNFKKVSGQTGGVLQRAVLPIYKNAQMKRWQTANTSEGVGGKWAPIKDKKYAKRKLVKYASYPGGGRKLMVATSELSAAAALSKFDHASVILSGSRLTITIKLPYASFVNEVRDFTHFGPITTDKIKAEIKKYVVKNT